MTPDPNGHGWPPMRDNGKPNRWHEFDLDPETGCCVICGWAEQVHTPTPTEPLTDVAVGSPLPLKHRRSCPALTPLSEAACTCGLSWRIRLVTEQEQHAAWRKRAEEAEAQFAAQQAALSKARVLIEAVRAVGSQGHWDAPHWTLHVPAREINALFDLAYELDPELARLLGAEPGTPDA